MLIYDFDIVLASSSPRRRQLLEDMNLNFKIFTPNVEEKYQQGELPEGYVKRNSKIKLDDVVSRYCKLNTITSPTLFIAADTIVVLNKEVLEKPKDDTDAIQMLSALSGHIHTVYTGVSLEAVFGDSTKFLNKTFKTFTVKTLVKIKSMSLDEIKKYVSTKESLDKAGAYAIQGKGGYIVERIEGSYSNVVGLPVCELYEAVKEMFS